MQRARGRSIFLGDFEATSISGGGFQPGSVGEPSVAVDDSTQQIDDKRGIVKEGGA